MLTKFVINLLGEISIEPYGVEHEFYQSCKIFDSSVVRRR